MAGATAIDSALIALVGIVWCIAWARCQRIVRACGVRSRWSAWALAVVPPTAVLIVSVQLLGTMAIAVGGRWIEPWTIALCYALVVLAVHHFIPATSQPEVVPQPRRATLPRPWLIPIIPLVAMHAVFLVDAITRFPTGYDSVHYHLPAAVSWLQSGTLNLDLTAPHLATAASGDILPMLLLAGGFERLLPLLCVPQGILLSVLVYELARQLGAGRTGRWIAGVVALSVPIVTYQMYSHYVDLFAAVMWLASLLALVLSTGVDRRVRTALWIIAGLAAGTAVGTRTTFVVAVAILAVAAFAFAAISRRREVHKPIHGVRAVVVFSIACAACCWFWPMRGLVQAGNPLYPISYSDGVWTNRGLPLDDVYAGVGRPAALPIASRVWHALRLPWHEEKFGSGYGYGVEDGTGAAYAMIVPVGVLAGVLLNARRRRSIFAKRRTIIIALIIVGGCLHLTLFKMYTRYSLVFLLLAIPLAAVWFDRLWRAHPRGMSALLTAAFSLTAAMAALQPARDLAGRLRDGNWSRAAFYLIPDLFDETPGGTVVLNACEESETMTYALAGRRLTNRVIDSVQWGMILGGRLPSASILRERGIDYVYFRGQLPELHGSMPADWPTDMPLELVFDDSQAPLSPRGPVTRVFRVIQSPVLSDLRSVASAGGR